MTSSAHRLRKPNLIILLPDQQRADTVGNPKVHSPNLAKLASESVIFDRAYVTQPVCSPSRASLMTGLWPHTTGCTENGGEIDSRFRVLPELIADEDYHAGYIGKWHLGPKELISRAFDERVSTQGASDYSEFLVSRGLTPDRTEGGFTELSVSNLSLELSQPKFLEKRACEFIERHGRRPFILVVAFVEPHSPYNGPLNSEHSLDEVDLDLTAEVPLDESAPLRYRLIREWQKEQALTDSTMRKFYFGVNQDDYRSLKQKYFGLVTLVDESIGAILGCLEQTGLRENTIVVHTSDHGDMLGAHQLFGKEVMFEEAVRVPYLIRLPGQRRSMRISQPISHIDFLPTLFELLGQTKLPHCPGQSRVPLLKGEIMPPQSVFMEWSPNRAKTVKRSSVATRRQARRAMEESTRAVVTSDGWKLCLRDQDLNELYNLKVDPIEAHNLYYDGQYFGIISRHADEIHCWQESTRDHCKLPKL